MVVWWRSNARRIWLGSASLALILGTVGYLDQDSQSLSMGTVVEAIYRAAQLFVLEANYSQPLSLSLQVGRFLAPFVTVTTVVTAVLVALEQSGIELRLRRLSGHVVVCGIGDHGLALVADALDDRPGPSGFTVVAVEVDGSNEHLEGCRGLGAIVLEAHAADRNLLARVRIERAAHLVAVCKDDDANLRIAALAAELAATRRSPPLRVHVKVADLALLTAVSQADLLEKSEGVDTELFDPNGPAARQLVQALLPFFPAGPTDSVERHVIVVGAGPVGCSVALQLAQLGHFGNERCLRVTVLDEDPPRGSRALRALYPALDPDRAGGLGASPFRFAFPPAAPGATTDSLVASAISLAREDAGPTAIVLAAEDDTRNVVGALRIKHALSATNVGPAIPRRPVFAHLSRGDTPGAFARLPGVQIFGPSATPHPFRALVDDDMDGVAKTVHAAYGEAFKIDKPWHAIPHHKKDSNRRYGDYLAIRVRAAGVALDDPRLKTLTAPENAALLESLSTFEHERWCAEQHLTAGSSVDATDTENPHRRFWETLSPEQQTRNRELSASVFARARLA